MANFLIRKAIRTRRLPATNFKPARISAKADHLPVMIMPWKDEWSDDDNHRLAAELYKRHYDWQGTLVAGWTEQGIIHVLLDDRYQIVRTKKS